MSSSPAATPLTRCGVIVIAGRPNVGKSTLLNTLLGEPLSIVSDKPQATRVPVVGVRSDRESQILFLDQPGILEPRYLMHRAMRQAVVETASDADAILYLLRMGQQWEPLQEVEPELARMGKPVAHVLSQTDRAGGTTPGVPPPVFEISALKQEGLEPLIAWCKDKVPVAPFRYDPEDVSTQPARFFVAEYVREAAFNLLTDELPYAIAAEVDEFREGTQPLYIRVTLFVERASQKNIVIGKGGATVREIGIAARQRVEALMGQKVFLDLWVKVLPKWRTKPSALTRFGLPLIPGKRT